MMWIWIFFFLAPNVCPQHLNFTSQNLISNPCTDQNHLFLAPGVLSAGGSNRACISRFHTDGTAGMTVTLVNDYQETTVATRELPPGDGGCLDITVPQRSNIKAKLSVSMWYPDYHCSWDKDLTVRVSSGKVLAIHTERARYRPGDIMRVRMLTLKADLTPAYGLIEEVWIEGPRGAWAGTRAAYWKDVRTKGSFAQVQYSLDELAPVGRWTVTASLADGTQSSASFLVGNYELPPFQLSVKHAPKVLRTSDRLVWTVCVRYPWTEAVEGMLVIRIKTGGGGVTGDVAAGGGSGGIRTVLRLRAPRACHRHAAAASRVALHGPSRPDVLVAQFSFQEDGTRVWQNTTVVSQIVDKPVSLEFMSKHQVVIAPRLPYKLKVKATRWDDKPASNEQVRVCRSRSAAKTKWRNDDVTKWPKESPKDQSCFEAVTDDRGIARVTFTANDEGSGYYIFQASLYNDSSVAAPPLYLASAPPRSVHAALGPLRPTGSSVQSNFDPAVVSTASSRTYVPLYVSLDKVDKPLTVHFVVITRGGIIHRWGATTQCPMTNSAEYIPTIYRNSQCYNAQNYNTNSTTYYNSDTNKSKLDANDPDHLVDRHLLRVMLPIKITHQMCPDSHLVAYFYHQGELITASKRFEMEDCFNNKVELNWLSRQITPGSTASIQVSTPGPALCALTVLDTAAKWIEVSSVKDVIMTGLKRLMESHRNLTEYDAAGACFLTSDFPELPADSSELTSGSLAAAGVRIIGGSLTSQGPVTSRCYTPEALTDDAVARSDFSEAWLWRVVGVGMNGSAVVSSKAPDSISRFEANAVCITRTGVAVSTPAVLQVFRELFIHADSPRKLTRGDSTIIRYRLFNYLYEPLTVQIQVLTDYHLQSTADRVRSVVVGGRGAWPATLRLRAAAAGRARLAIRATGQTNNTTGRVVSDEVIIEIMVEPEGIPQQDHKSILLCGRESEEISSSDVSWNWSPFTPVPGTEALTVWAAGDIAGPLLADADGIVPLPRGCGEQNLARLATNLLALRLLPATARASVAKEHVARGYMRQLQYAHPQGGFSAFGPKDKSPSTWLTAFSLKYLRQAHQIVNPGLPLPPVLLSAERWLLHQQMENGCFRNVGQVFHRELKGGLSEEGEMASVALTAYVVSTLGPDLPTRLLPDALSCLRAFPSGKTRSPTRVYAQALVTYAFLVIRSNEDEIRKMNEASYISNQREAYGLKDEEENWKLMEFLKMAKKTDEYLWWETSSLSTSIEATAYGLLSLLRCDGAACRGQAARAARWLTTHRQLTGGFLSTQDTLVALEALSAWSSSQPSIPANLTVTVRSGNDVKTATILPGDKVPEIMKLEVNDQLDVSVEGTGCTLIQATRSYNTLSPKLESDLKHLSVQVEVHTDGLFNCDTNATNCFCAATIETCVSWTDSFPEMALLEVWLPSGFTVDAALLYSQLTPKDPFLGRIEVGSAGGRVTLYLSGSEAALAPAHACYSTPAVGPAADTRPSRVILSDYYTRDTHTQMYTIPKECPPRIVQQVDDFATSDNLYNKAKSLKDSGEILITHEFSFEDIPEGFPLEDPLYDSYNRDQVAYLVKNNENKAINKDFGETERKIYGKEPTAVKLQVDIETKDRNIIKSDSLKLQENLTVEQFNHSSKRNSNDISKTENNKYNEENRFEVKNTDSTYIQNHKEADVSASKTKYNIVLASNNSDPSTINKENIINNANSHKHDALNLITPKTSTYDTTEEANLVTGENNRVTLFDQKDYSNNVGVINNGKVENPGLSDFHVIDSEADLDVPTGMEGPVPSVVLPPPNFVPSMPPDSPPPMAPFSRRYPHPANVYFYPYEYPNYHYMGIDGYAPAG